MYGSSKLVKSSGPEDAQILIIGEAPGKEEVTRGEPFVGVTGIELERAFRSIGVNFRTEVRKANVVTTNPGKFPAGAKGARLMLDHAKQLDKELSNPNYKVIVLCGGVALRRVVGESSIEDWRGSVFTPDDLPDEVVLYEKKQLKLTVDNVVKHDCKIIPMLHPAGIVRTKERDNNLLVMRDVLKVGKAAKGKLKTYDFTTTFNPSVAEVWDAFKASDGVVAFDTEFNPENGSIYWLGMSFDGKHVYGMPWTHEYISLIVDLFKTSSTFVAHNILADLRVMRKAGVEIAGKLYCTMIGMYVLNPGQRVGLSPSARFYLDHIKHWKGMEKDDPYYNALDVIYCWHVREGIEKDINSRLISPRAVFESRLKLIPVCDQMEMDGLLVDLEKRDEHIKIQEDRIEALLVTVMARVAPYWDKKMMRLREDEKLKTVRYESMREAWKGYCEKHPKKYPGKSKSKTCERCMGMYEEGRDWYEKYMKAQKLATAARNKLKKELEEGFNFKSPKQLAWLLYDADALNLPQKRKFGKITTDADTIERLSKMKYVQKRGEAFEVILWIKEMQQAAKALSTFLRLERKGVSLIGSDGCTHPPYKIHGTKTGRIAGGEDKAGELDKVDSTGAYNPLNIPEKWRGIYRASEGKIIVGADWKNQEGRLMALFSGDRGYIEAFKNEDDGGDDVHSITAAIIYGIDPKDARKVKKKFNGSMYDARHCAKVANHAASYSPTPVRTLMKNFQMTVEEAVRVRDALREARPGIDRYKEDLVRECLGVWEPKEWRGNWRAVCVENGSRWVYTPFGWQLRLFGMGEVLNDPERGRKEALPVQAGEVVALRAQGSGGEMWARCAPELAERYPIFTGTYDSFYISVPDEVGEVKVAMDLLYKVMEREWPELDGWTFPIDVCVGYNWGKYDEDENPYGLKEV